MAQNAVGRSERWRRWSRQLCVPVALALGALLLAAPGTFAHAAAPFTVIVNSTADMGGFCTATSPVSNTRPTCTLRQAINESNANDPGPGGHNTIGITAVGTITLGSALPAFSKNVTIAASTVNNRGVIVDGGHAVPVFVVGSGVMATIEAMGISNGNAGNGNGGGILNNGALTVTAVQLTGNHAFNGGGIANTGALWVTDSTFSANSGIGGGIYDAGSLLTVTNSTFSGNSTAGEGGGIFHATGNLDVTNSTFAENSARNGGGIFNNTSGTLHLTNTIVAGNSATVDGPDIRSSTGFVPTTGHNLIGSTSGMTGITNGKNGDIVSATPHLGALAYNGGRTWTMALLTGSPAIDAGDDAVCGSTGTTGVNNKDQRGAVRPYGAHCDIGAVEATPSPPPVTNLDWTQLHNTDSLTPPSTPSTPSASSSLDWTRVQNSMNSQVPDDINSVPPVPMTIPTVQCNNVGVCHVVCVPLN